MPRKHQGPEQQSCKVDTAHAITQLGITIPRTLLLAHLAILLRPVKEPSTFESLPAEIITRIAEVATDKFTYEQEQAAKAEKGKDGGKCCCCGGVHGKRVAKEVEALAGTSRRIRAVIVAAGFFSAITVDSDVDALFRKSVRSTDEFLERVKVAVMRLNYTSPQNAPLDIPNLRHAFRLYPSLRDLWLDYSLTTAAPTSSHLPALPPAKGVPPPERILEGLQTLTLNISDRKARQHARGSASKQPLMVQHLAQMVPIFAVPSLEELDVRMHFQDTSISVRKALRQTGDALKGVKLERLRRLGLNLDFELDYKKEISGGWLSVLVKTLNNAQRISSNLTDIEITIFIKTNSTRVFTLHPTTDDVSLAGLIPTREQVVDALRQLADTQGKENMLPFTLLEYIPATYGAETEKRKTLPERMLDIPEALAKHQNKIVKEALGGDELRFAVNHVAIEELYQDVIDVESVRRAGIPLPGDARTDDEDPEWEDVDDGGLPVPMMLPLRMPTPFDLGVEDMPPELEIMLSSMMMAAMAGPPV